MNSLKKVMAVNSSTLTDELFLRNLMIYELENIVIILLKRFALPDQ